MLGINIDDVIAVLQSVAPYLAVIVLALVVGIVVTVVTTKNKTVDYGKRRLIRTFTWIGAGAATVGSVNGMLEGPLESTVTMATDEKHELTDETIDSTNNLAVDIEDEGIVLLQNEGNVLPLASGAALNVFGWASTNPIYGGTGSGSLSDQYETVSLLEGLSMAGFSTNEELSSFYTDYATERGAISVTAADWTLSEPPASTYSDELMDNAKSFSSTALVVLGRVGGEGLDLPIDMNADDVIYNENSSSYVDFPAGAHYLELSQSEKDMIDLVCQNFDDVVLIYNGANAFELGFVEEYPQIKSVLWAPHPGQAGFESLGRVLAGTVNPSGRTPDTFLYDLTQAPCWNNFGDFPYDNVSEFEIESARGIRSPRFVNYVEGIYVGYRFYETADDEGLIDYDATVQYPFGYGLSYTSFTQEMGTLSYADGTVSLDVTVTNTGSVAGKDVVEVYVNPPYVSGGFERASANLVAFGKTSLLEPGASETLSLSFEDDDLAIYDYEGAQAYVLEAGDYVVSINSDAHTVIAEQTLTIAQTVTYDTDDNTHNGDAIVATNVFDEARGSIEYLSRADGFANYATATAAPTDYSMSDEYKATYYNNGNYDPLEFDDPDDEMPTTGADNGLRLYDLRGVDYDDEQWDLLLDELTVDEMNDLIANGGYGTAAIDSVGKIRLSDVDGPAALNNNFTGESSIGLPANVAIACSWNRDLARQFGQSIGTMAREMEVAGWYAPSINIHRSSFAGRNFEYFSEDPLLTGTLAAEQMLGAAEYGVYAYVKHFALNEQETQRNGQLCTWSNEQAIREVYLRPFEIVIKSDPDAQGVMGSFNYIGNTYASAHLGLNQTVLRDEWGFRGTLITDYFSGLNYGYQNADQVVRGGTDLMLAATETTNYVTDLSATAVIQMRRASKNILYTAANSWLYEDGDPSAEIESWRLAMYGVDAVSAVALVAAGVVAVRHYRAGDGDEAADVTEKHEA